MAVRGDQTSKMSHIESFKRDVDEGLGAKNKHLPSRYFYDKRGDALFVEIMNTPEYYLSRAELEIWTDQSNRILENLQVNSHGVDVFELGAGDGTKTIELLKVLNGHSYDFKPIDISQNALDKLEDKIKATMPQVRVNGIRGEYFQALKEIQSDRKKIILFLGSNIGNLDPAQSEDFIGKLRSLLRTGDKLVIGFDLKKPKSVVLPAYDDSKGFTRDFNLNLLERINNELGGNFNLALFDHSPEYDEDTGVARSYLESKVDQKVYIKAIGKEYSFQKGEKIHTEISRKFTLEEIKRVASRQNLRIVETFFDSNRFFTDIIFEKEEQ